MPGFRKGPPVLLRGVPYTVSTPVFEGPFDLLLHLITREQVDLWEVSLADIVDAYVATLEQIQAALDLEAATEFLLIAAVLLELKARRLLPGRDDVELEEELALWEERDLLLARLLECKTFKDAAGTMQRIMDVAGRSWPRSTGSTSATPTWPPTFSRASRPSGSVRSCRRSSSPSRRPGCCSTMWHQSESACATRWTSWPSSCPARGGFRSPG